MKNQNLRFALFASLSLIAFSALAQKSEAQLLNKLRGDYGGDTQIQYSPDDPSTRNRLFNLQTGHAGAFYNCDGEEDKRNSPHICWKHGPCAEKFHCAMLDILDWRRDRDEIAQRICDGAGACCSGGCCNEPNATAISAPAPCGCSECLAAKASDSAAKTSVAVGSKAKSLMQRPFAKSNPTNVVGLVTQKAASVLEQSKPAKKVCDCADCRAKRTSGLASNVNVAAKGPASQPAGTTRSASLLDRARSARKQR